MKKTEFLEALETCLDGMDESERRASVEYYAEMIDQRIEDGMDEESAVGALGSPFLAAEQLRAARADAQTAQTSEDGEKTGQVSARRPQTLSIQRPKRPPVRMKNKRKNLEIPCARCF